jgi:hypothetical protein
MSFSIISPADLVISLSKYELVQAVGAWFHSVRSHSADQAVNLSSAISLSSIIGEMAEDYNSYFKLSVRKRELIYFSEPEFWVIIRLIQGRDT